MKKRLLVGIIVLLVLLPIVASQTVDEEGGFGPPGGSPQSNDIDYQNLNQAEFQQLSGNQLDFSKVKQFNREKDLTSDQLVVKKDNTYNLDKVDPNKLDTKVRDDTLKKLGRAKNVESETGNQPAQITTFDNGWSIDNILLLTVDGIHIVNGQGITYRDNNLTVDHAETLYFPNGVIFNVDNFSGIPIEFDVGSVNQVQDGCISLYGLENSHLKSDDKNLEISTQQNGIFSIRDCGKAETQFEAFGNNSSITISKEPGKPAHYDITKGTLSCENLDHSKDILIGNTTASVDMGKNCFSCLTINPVGSYWNLAHPTTSFIVKIPKESEEYSLCIRKIKGQPVSNSLGLIDFANHSISLGGMVEYHRLSFELLADDFRLLPPFGSVSIYESFDENNKAQLSLDDDFIFIESFHLENDRPQTKILATTHSGYHTITESSLNSYSRFGKLEHQPVSDILRSYTTKNILPSIWINGSLTQRNKKLNTTVTIHPPVPDTPVKLINLLQHIYERNYLMTT